MKFIRKYPFIVFPKVSNCLVCAFKSLIVVSLLVKSECPHTVVGVLKPRIISFPLGGILYPALAAVLIVASVVNYEYSLKTDADIIERVLGVLTQIWTIVVIISTGKNRHNLAKYFNGINELVLKSKQFGVPTIFPARFVQKTQYGSLYIIIVSGTMAVMQFIRLIYNDGCNFVVLASAMSSFMNIFFGGLTATYTVYFLNVYETMFRKILELVRQEFEERKQCPILSFADKLRSFQQFYDCCVLNYSNHVLYYATLPFAVSHFVLVIACQVLPILYISFTMVQPNAQVSEGITVGLMESAFVVGITFYIVNRCDNIYNMNSQLVSYLYKYTISALNREEAYLTEGLIASLTTYKPILIPANIFEIRKHIIPSVVGHVITYSLVAMQFNIFDYFY